jgi:hypothetical protein
MDTTNSNNCATLGTNGKFTVFKYRDTTLRFKSPYSLEKFTQVKNWDNGYIVVMAKYSHNAESEEDYIDIVPILENLYINPVTFLKPIKNVVLV